MRVLISSTCSFWLSRAAVLRARELDAAWAHPDHMPILGEGSWLDDESRKNREESYPIPDSLPRHDPLLLQVYDELGGTAMAPKEESYGGIDAVEIPDDVTYFIGSYLGEWVSEAHRVWDETSGIEGRPGGYERFTKDSKFSS